MGLLGSEQGLFIVSKCTAPNTLELTDRQLFHTAVLRNVALQKSKIIGDNVERHGYCWFKAVWCKFKVFSSIEGNSTNRALMLSPSFMLKHREHRSRNAKVLLPIKPIGIVVAFNFTLFGKTFVETAVNLPCCNGFLLSCLCRESSLFSLHYIYLEKTILFLAKKDK